MKYYCQFTKTIDIEYNDKMQAIACKPYQSDVMGDRGVFILDGRNNIDTMIDDCINQFNCIKNNHKKITGFKIVRANSFITTGKIIYCHMLDTAWND